MESGINRKLQDYVKKLKREGYRITPQRLEIIKVILERGEHTNADELYKIIRERYPMISLATIYNTLEILVNTGLIKKLEFSSASLYDTKAYPHINLICTNCKKIFDFPLSEEEVTKLKEKIKKDVHFTVKSLRIDFYGTCKNCKTQ